MKLYVMLINGTVQGVFPSLNEAAIAFENCVFDLPGGLERMVEMSKEDGRDCITCEIATCEKAILSDGRASFVNRGGEARTQIAFDGTQLPPPPGGKIVTGPKAVMDALNADPKKLN